MTVHAFLCRYLPPRVADILTGLWFALVLGLILLCGPTATGVFRYQNF